MPLYQNLEISEAFHLNPGHDKEAVEVFFSRKTNTVQQPALYFSNALVHKEEKHRHLDLLLDTKLSFLEHINEKINKTYKIIGTLRFLSKYLPLHSLDKIYKMMIRSHLDYCDVIYHVLHANAFPFTLNSLMEKLERVQYNAALAITGTWRGINRSKLYEELGWESLNDRRWSRRLIQFCKIHNNLNSAIPERSSSSCAFLLYGVRHPYNYRNIYDNSSSYQNSFYPNAIRLRIDRELHERKSLETFEKCITSVIKPHQKSLFRIYNPRHGGNYKLKFRIHDVTRIIIFRNKN